MQFTFLGAVSNCSDTKDLHQRADTTNFAKEIPFRNHKAWNQGTKYSNVFCAENFRNMSDKVFPDNNSANNFGKDFRQRELVIK
jgi:hypothetical protein